MKVSADGFLPEIRRINLERRKQHVVTIALERNRHTAGVRAARNGAVASFVVGAAGLGVGAGTGVLAFAAIHDVQSRGSGIRCPPSEQANVNADSTLGSVSTTSLVLVRGRAASRLRRCTGLPWPWAATRSACS